MNTVIEVCLAVLAWIIEVSTDLHALIADLGVSTDWWFRLLFIALLVVALLDDWRLRK